MYFRPYSGERLCPSCFRETIVERVKKTINKYDMFEHDSRIAVGVSGGKDSLTLLRMLYEIEAERPNAEMVVICVDEGVKGYRDEALRIAEKLCRQLKVEMRVIPFRQLFGETMDELAAKDRTLGTCSYCGVLRRKALNEGAKSVEADRLATGHNLDDMAQSVIMNVLRGDMKRIESFNPGGNELPGFIRRVKPLCEVPERETTLLAYLYGIDFQSLPCPYASEALRTDVRRFLNQMEYIRPGTKSIVYNTGLKLVHNAEKNDLLGSCLICGSPSSGKICRACELMGKSIKIE
jgi:cytoplasmic tRNA 2-thiolation protein 1